MWGKKKLNKVSLNNKLPKAKESYYINNQVLEESKKKKKEFYTSNTTLYEFLHL